MKKIKIIIAAVLATCLTACSFFSKDELNNEVQECQVILEGGSGRTSVNSPAKVVSTEKGYTVELVWSSPNYDYMIVEGTRFENEAEPGENSVFNIPFSQFDEAFTVIADTTAMSTPHEIEYTLTVCSNGAETETSKESGTALGQGTDKPANLGKLTKTGSMELSYAKEFTVDYYIDENNNEYSFISIGDTGSKQYFLIGSATCPEGISDNVTYLESVDKTYLVSTSVMDLIVSISALDNIKFSGTKSSDWYIKEAKEKMKDSEILYAGKYSAPDYELLVTGGCNLAIENTMIYHNPEVKEKLESLCIPVLVERSSYENNPLGRLEWIKLYGVLYGHLEEANALFNQQLEEISKIEELESTGKTVAFFSIDSNGMINIRKPGDYISKMINMAGATYVPDDLEFSDENALSTMKITMEDFYLYASEADVLIYNSTIEGEIDSVDELLSKSAVISDFKAVKEGKVYCLEKSYFQQSSDVAEFIEDIHNILYGNDDSLKHIYKLKE